MNTYCIKDGYQHNNNPVPYLDSLEDSVTYQLDVYTFAASIIKKNHAHSIVDIGCGLGSKLEQYIQSPGNQIFGVDCEASIQHCRKAYDFGEWIIDDIENPRYNPARPVDAIICSDVVEHLVNPDLLFDYFLRWSHKDTQIIISTPERDLRRGPDDMGPPQNTAHVREWNSEEFSRYLTSQGLNVREHKIVELRAGMLTCQLALCSWQDKVTTRGNG